MDESYQTAGTDQREFLPQDASRGTGLTQTEALFTSYASDSDSGLPVTSPDNEDFTGDKKINPGHSSPPDRS